MKILMLNKYYYLRGGSERYFFDLSRLLESHGHTVIPFSMHNERNEPSEWSRFFVPEVEYTGPMSPWHKIRAAAGTIHSPLARRNVEALVRETKPDIVHAHNIYHQLSYSPLAVAKSRGIPVVLTAHDYKLVCPNNQFFRRAEICERCAGRHFRHAFTQRCGKGAAGSLVLAIESYVNRRLNDAVKKIDAIITPSRFMHDKFIEYGLPEEKVIHRYNMLDAAAFDPEYETQGYILYFGRLAAEKGVLTLLRSMQRLPQVRLLLAGEGPERPSLESESGRLGLRNVEFLGYRSGQALEDVIRGASVIVVPSEWHENQPYSVLEAMAYGKAVIGARIGGIPELVEDGKSGLLFTAGDAGDLARKLEQALADPQNLQRMGRQGRARVEQEFAPEPHYRFMLELYERLLQSRLG